MLELDVRLTADEQVKLEIRQSFWRKAVCFIVINNKEVATIIIIDNRCINYQFPIVLCVTWLFQHKAEFKVNREWFNEINFL